MNKEDSCPDCGAEVNSMREYVNRRMPMVWNLIMPLNQRGVMLDVTQLRIFQADRAKKMKTWRKRAEKHFKELSLGEYDKKLKTLLPIGLKGGFSNKKLRRLVYEEMDLPEQLNPEGNVTCDKDALKRLAKIDSTGTIDLLRETTAFQESRNALMVKPHPDGRVRTRFVFGGDEKWTEDEVGRESPGSGRLASRNPNLQNIKDWVRAIYVPRSRGRWLIKADYSQIEMRLIAILSGDPELLKAIETDAHLYIMYLVDKATDLYGLHKRGFPQLLKDYRRGDSEVVFARDETKRTDYGWGYRMGVKTLENVRGVPVDRGLRALAALNREFHYVVEWWNSLEAEVRRTAAGTGMGYLQNQYGRVRHFFTDDKKWVPKACNFFPQGLAADILYDAMETLEKNLHRFDSELVLTCHDEVVIDCPANPEEVIPYIKEVMERPVPELDGLVVPVDIMLGRNWAKFHRHGKGCKKHCAKHENVKGQRNWKEALNAA